MDKVYPLLLPMLIIILPATACRLTTNKLPDEATLYPGQERTQAENTPQILVLNEESGGSKGELEFFGGGYDIPTIVGSGGKRARESADVFEGSGYSAQVYCAADKI
jgi:hypothetical protein